MYYCKVINASTMKERIDFAKLGIEIFDIVDKSPKEDWLTPEYTVLNHYKGFLLMTLFENDKAIIQIKKVIPNFKRRYSDNWIRLSQAYQNLVVVLLRQDKFEDALPITWDILNGRINCVNELAWLTF
jgi:hypothetical protein